MPLDWGNLPVGSKPAVDDEWFAGIVPEEYEKKEYDKDPMPPEGFFTLELIDKTQDFPVKEEWDATGEKKRAGFRFEIITAHVVQTVDEKTGEPLEPEQVEGTKFMYWVNISLVPNAPFRLMVDALAGGKLPPGVGVGMSMIMHKRLQAQVKNEPGKKDANKDKLYTKLFGPAPVVKGKGKPKPAGDPPF